MRISDWSSDVCSSDLRVWQRQHGRHVLAPTADRVGEARLASLAEEISLRVLAHQQGQPDPGQQRQQARVPGRAAFGARWRVAGAGLAGIAESPRPDRKSVVWEKGGSVRVDQGGPRTIKKKNQMK